MGELSGSVTELLLELINVAPVSGWLLILLVKPSAQHCQGTVWWSSDGDGSHSGDECHWPLLSCCVCRLWMLFHQCWCSTVYHRGTYPEAMGPAEGKPLVLPCHRLGWPWTHLHALQQELRCSSCHMGGVTLWGLLHFKHPGTCMCGVKDMGSMFGAWGPV